MKKFVSYFVGGKFAILGGYQSNRDAIDDKLRHLTLGGNSEFSDSFADRNHVALTCREAL